MINTLLVRSNKVCNLCEIPYVMCVIAMHALYSQKQLLMIGKTFSIQQSTKESWLSVSSNTHACKFETHFISYIEIKFTNAIGTGSHSYFFAINSISILT